MIISVKAQIGLEIILVVKVAATCSNIYICSAENSCHKFCKTSFLIKLFWFWLKLQPLPICSAKNSAKVMSIDTMPAKETHHIVVILQKRIGQNKRMCLDYLGCYYGNLYCSDKTWLMMMVSCKIQLSCGPAVYVAEHCIYKIFGSSYTLALTAQDFAFSYWRTAETNG